MTKNQLLHKIGELDGIIYWHERGTFPKDNIDEVRCERESLLAKLKARDYDPEFNKNGCKIYRGGHRENDVGHRYFFDFKACTPKKGWKQYDTSQDAWYFGVWVNLENRKILTYAEGDVTVVICSDDDALRAELKEMAEFYGEPPPAFTAIGHDGSVTKHYDERPAI